MALYPAGNEDEWVFIGVTKHHLSGAVKAFTMSGFYGGDPQKRLPGYEQLEDEND